MSREPVGQNGSQPPLPRVYVAAVLRPCMKEPAVPGKSALGNLAARTDVDDDK